MLLLIAIIIITAIFALFMREANRAANRGIDNPIVGFCGKVNSDDARVFGPVIWPSLHMIAHNYPKQPIERTQEECVNFINSMVYMLPCSKCGRHFQEFLQLNEQLVGVTDPRCMGVGSESTCQSLQTTCSSKNHLTNFFTRAHNSVNAHVYPDRALFTVAQSEAIWQDQETCITAEKWGGDPFPR